MLMRGKGEGESGVIFGGAWVPLCLNDRFAAIGGVVWYFLLDWYS